MNRAIFLDRDGTIMENVPYLRNPERVRLFDDAIEALTALKEAGYLLVLASNQSLVGRGMGTVDEVQKVHARMVALLSEGGIALDGAYYCYDAPDVATNRRKPNPDMLLEAAAELDVNLADSAMIGDSVSDVEAGQNAGCGTSILLGASDVEGGWSCASNLEEAARMVLST